MLHESSLVIQWLGFHASNAWSPSLLPAWGTSQKEKKKSSEHVYVYN